MLQLLALINRNYTGVLLGIIILHSGSIVMSELYPTFIVFFCKALVSALLLKGALNLFTFLFSQ